MKLRYTVIALAAALATGHIANAGEAEAKKWIDSEFQPSTLSKDQQMTEMKFFIEAAKRLQAKGVKEISVLVASAEVGGAGPRRAEEVEGAQGCGLGDGLDVDTPVDVERGDQHQPRPRRVAKQGVEQMDRREGDVLRAPGGVTQHRLARRHEVTSREARRPRDQPGQGQSRSRVAKGVSAESSVNQRTSSSPV